MKSAGNDLGQVDWLSKESVIAYCKRLNEQAEGVECCVVKYADRQNYNITFTSRVPRDPNVEIIYVPSKRTTH